MMHTISKIKHITDKDAERYTELEFIRMIVFENLQSEREIYQMKNNNNK